jgi:hypothetical protein
MASSRRTGTNEHISTYGNETRDYTALATWESATDNNLVSLTQSEVLECYADSSIFTDNVILSGAVTNSSYFRIIRPAAGQGHNGTPNAGVRFRRTTNGYTFYIIENNSSIQDIGATLNCGWSVVQPSVFYGVGNNNSMIGCIAFDALNAYPIGASGFYIEGAGLNPLLINCLAINCQSDGFKIKSYEPSCYIYNSTSANNGGYGFNNIDGYGGATIAKNCCSSGNTLADWYGTITKTTCTEEGATPTFVDPDNDDFHLDPDDTVCRNKGTNLSTDEVFPFSDDVDGDERAE